MASHRQGEGPERRSESKGNLPLTKWSTAARSREGGLTFVAIVHLITGRPHPHPLLAHARLRDIHLFVAFPDSGPSADGRCQKEDTC
jgi:hypothetical protein